MEPVGQRNNQRSDILIAHIDNVFSLRARRKKRQIMETRELLWKPLYTFVWVVCWGFTIRYSYELINYYIAMNPISLTTYLDTNSVARPGYGIVNNAYLDPYKIMNYNGSAGLFGNMQEINGSVMEDHLFGSQKEAVNLTVHPSNHLFISRRNLEAFKVDLDQFMIGCTESGHYVSCHDVFNWSMECASGCYKSANANIPHCGEFFSHSAYFYFDPELHMGRFTSNIGAKVTLNGAIKTIKVNPNELVEVAAESVFLSQEESLPKLRCTDKEGPQSHNFTGSIFETPYSPGSCEHLCVAEFGYAICNCSFLIGWNISNSECIENKQNRDCIQRLFTERPDNRHILKLKSCVFNCFDQCNSHQFDFTVSKSFNYPSPFYLIQELNLMRANGVNSPLVTQMLAKIESKNHRRGQIEASREMAKNVAKIVVYSSQCSSLMVTRSEKMITFPTLMSNIGGTLGMWLGLSVFSLVGLLEKLVGRLTRQSQTKRAQIVLDKDENNKTPTM